MIYAISSNDKYGNYCVWKTDAFLIRPNKYHFVFTYPSVLIGLSCKKLQVINIQLYWSSNLSLSIFLFEMHCLSEWRACATYYINESTYYAVSRGTSVLPFQHNVVVTRVSVLQHVYNRNSMLTYRNCHRKSLICKDHCAWAYNWAWWQMPFTFS